MSRIGIIGVGKWGQNLLRVFMRHTKVVACAVSKRPLAEARMLHRGARWTHDYGEILDDPSIDAVVIATPIPTHFRIAREALMKGKHVWVEKPLCQSNKEARELVRLARRKKRILFVGHVFLYHPVLGKILRLTEKDPIFHVASEWNKMGSFDEDIYENLFSHEVALSLGLFQGVPRKSELLYAHPKVSKADDVETVLHYAGGRTHFMHVNRHSASKEKVVQLTTAGGKMYAWNGNDLFAFDSKFQSKKIFSSVREPLVAECKAFLSSIRTGKPPLTDGVFGEKVVKVVSRFKGLKPVKT